MLLIGWAVLQVATFGLFGFDKARARNGDRRVRERTLLLAALFGGVGAWLGQRMLRHKTRKEPFRTWLGLAVGLHLLAVGGGVWWVLG
ncbi:MAG: DUF1294 domain-containing protein [Brevundimonas sp.]|nr:DUF1294 domain-containing protein [Brevundimonas sp.]